MIACFGPMIACALLMQVSSAQAQPTTHVRIWSQTTEGKKQVTEIKRKGNTVTIDGRKLSAKSMKKNQASIDRVLNPKVDGSFFSAPCTKGKYTHHVTRNVKPIVIEGCLESRHGQTLFRALKSL